MKIKTFTPSSHKVKALIYGAAGSGKTKFGGTAPKVIWAAAEQGLLSVADTKPQFVDIKTIGDLKELHSMLLAGEHEYETVVLDTITELNERIKEGLERARGGAMQLRDWGTLSKQIKQILRDFMDLNMHVIFLSQEALTKDEDRIEKITPAMNGKTEYEIPRYFDIVGYCYVTGSGKGRKHHIDTNQSEKTLAKDRSGLIGDDAPLDFSKWIARISKMEIERPVFDGAKLEETEEWIKGELNRNVKIEDILNMIKQKHDITPAMEKKVLAIKTHNPLPDEEWEGDDDKAEGKEKTEEKTEKKTTTKKKESTTKSTTKTEEKADEADKKESAKNFKHYKEAIESAKTSEELEGFNKEVKELIEQNTFTKSDLEKLIEISNNQKKEVKASEALDTEGMSDEKVDKILKDVGIATNEEELKPIRTLFNKFKTKFTKEQRVSIKKAVTEKSEALKKVEDDDEDDFEDDL